MERLLKPWIAVLGAVLLLVLVFLGGYEVAQRRAAVPGVSGSSIGFDQLRSAYGEIVSSAVKPPDQVALARGAIKGMIKVLNKEGDKYAFFFGPKSYRSFQELTTGKFSGIGVWLKQQNGALAVVSVLPSSPALSAGIKPGDLIRKIDGRPVTRMSTDQAVATIKGPEGSPVSLAIERHGSKLSFRLKRQTLRLPSLVSKTLPGKIGYIHLFSFSQGAGEQLRQKVDHLVAGGAKGLILDLRDNGGGLLDEGVNVASVFINSGKIVTTKSPGGADQVYVAKENAIAKLPLVVLVNGGTASASEIVSGALQDDKRAILVGTTTYGKGSVQQIFPLSGDSAMKLTTEHYYTPSGRDINGRGIKPDVVVKAVADQQPRAIQILKGIIASSQK
ncbi:MAG: carboxyl-terminal processing protease [Actinomycetota bacterium]|jgi:carboxyl-terminal processing protease|nr:carboxyl-terminal processing protease [Actinomycetota bacterium]